MDYPVEEHLIINNRPKTPLKPQGFVVHSTATPGATAMREYEYFNSGYRAASVHYFADWERIIRTIPEKEMAWHAGKTANQRFLSVEMCEPTNIDDQKFNEVWKRTVWLVGDACLRYGWNPQEDIYSHNEISQKYHETNHTDPIGYLKQYDKTWEDFLKAVDREIEKLKSKDNNADAEKNKREEEPVEHAVLFYGTDDYTGAKHISERYNNCAMYQRKDNKTFNQDALKAKHLIVVGGPPVGHPNVTYLSGKTWVETAVEVGKFLENL